MICDIKPGDFIEWVYTYDAMVVPDKKLLWSRYMRTYVPIGGKNNLLIIITTHHITWLNHKGLFTAWLDDMSFGLGASWVVSPRALTDISHHE